MSKTHHIALLANAAHGLRPQSCDRRIAFGQEIRYRKGTDGDYS